MSRLFKSYLFLLFLLSVSLSSAKAQDFGSTEAFTTVVPKHGQFTSGSTLFNWNLRDSVSEYQLQISKDASFASIIADSSLQQNKLRIELTQSGTYFWKVYALRNGTRSDSTNTSTFNVFSPKAVDSLNLWLRGDSGITEVGGQISEWLDLSDSALVLTQTRANNQPTLIQEGLNGYDVVDFDATRDVFANVVDIDKENYYISVLYNYHGASGRPLRLITGNPSGSNWILGPYQQHQLFNGSKFIGGVPIVQDRFALNTAFSSGDSVKNIVNNVEIDGDSKGNIPGLLTLGATNSDFMDGSVAEVVMVNGTISREQADSLDKYLLDRYAPPIDLGENQMVCNLPVKLSAKRDYLIDYEWSQGAMVDSIMVNSSGKYLVTTTDIFDRSFVDSVIITQDTVDFRVNFAFDDTTICLGTSIEVEIPASDLYSYSWNTGEQGRILQIDSAGLYKVTVTNCIGNSSVDSINVIVNNPEFSLGNDTSICYYDSLLLESDSLFSMVNYSWSNSLSDPTITIRNSGEYILTVTDAFNCAFSDTIQVFSDSILLGIDLGPDTTLCSGSTVGLVEPIPNIDSYVWNSGQMDSSITVETSQKYIVTLTENGCVNSDSTTITIKGLAPQAGFTQMDQCFGDSIRFEDTSIASGGINISMWTWDFGNGKSSNLENPTTFFDSSGVYAVRLTVVNDSNCSSVAEVPITIHPKPEASFNASLSCSGDSTVFTNSSSLSLGVFNSYFWNFGDLSTMADTSIDQNPKYTFPTDGFYDVSMIATSDQGCKDTSTLSVQTFPSPLVSFSVAEPYLEDSVFFSNGSSVSSGTLTSYLWDFGNGDNSSLIEPKTLFTALGKYQVQLTATSDAGCATTFEDSVEIVNTPPPTPEFNTVLPKQGQVHESRVDFTWNEKDTVDSYILELAADKLFSSVIQRNSTILKEEFSIHLAIGNYYWRVISVHEGLFTDTTNTAFFSVFTAKGLDSLNLWLRGDTGIVESAGQISEWNDLSDSLLVLSQTDVDDQPTLIQEGLNGYSVVDFDEDRDIFRDVVDIDKSNYYIATVYNFHESAGRPTRLITGLQSQSNWILGPYIGHRVFNGRNFLGNGPSIVQNRFVINSAYADGDSLSHYVNNSLQEKGELGEIPGSLSIGSTTSDFMNGSVAEIIMVNGSIDENKRDSIDQYLMDKYAPPIDLGIDRKVCSFPDSISLDLDYIVDYEWSDGGTSSTLVVDSAGKYYVTATDIFNRITIDSMFFILDTLDFQVDFRFEDTTICEGNSIELFAGKNLYTYRWNTGDSLSSITVDSTAIYYVTVTNCIGESHSDSITVNVNQPVFDLGVDTTICFNQLIQLSPDSSFVNVNYEWSTGESLSTITADTAQLYRLTVTDDFGCNYTDSIDVGIDSNLFGLTLGNDTTLCAGNLIGLQNPNSSITSYLWSTANNTARQIVDTAGAYKLQVSNGLCFISDTIEISIKGQAPTAGFNSTRFCFRDTVEFFDLSAAPAGDTIVNWEWDFGDAVLSSLSNPKHSYGEVNNFEVLLQVETNRGCTDTVVKTISIDPKPVSDFTSTNSCAKNDVLFRQNASILSGFISRYSWDFGDPQSSNNLSVFTNPTHVFDTLGTYSIQLIVESDAGCFDTIVKEREINPAPAISFAVEGTCLGDSIQFIDQTILPKGTVDSYRWILDNNNTESRRQNPKFKYFSAGEKPIALRVISDSSCQAIYYDTIVISEPPIADFITSIYCEGNPISIENNSFSSDSIVSYQYIFDDSDTSILRSPIFESVQAGSYDLKLKTVTTEGCIDSIVKPIDVNPNPIADFSILNNSTGIPFAVRFENNSSLADRFIWDFGNGDTSSVELPVYTYLDTGTFEVQLKVESSFGCADSTSRQLIALPTFLDATLERVELVETNFGELQILARIINSGFNTIEQVQLTADINNEYQFRETINEEIFSGDRLGYQFNSVFIQEEGRRVDFVCVRIQRVNGGLDSLLSNNEICEEGFKEELFLRTYPNPTKDYLTIDYVLPEDGELTVNIYDQFGRSVLKEIVMNQLKGFYDLKIAIEGLTPGIYWYNFQFNGISKTDAFVKE